MTENHNYVERRMRSLKTLKEYVTFKKFTDSLLVKTNKLHDLSGQLDEASSKDGAAPHQDRIQKSFALILTMVQG